MRIHTTFLLCLLGVCIHSIRYSDTDLYSWSLPGAAKILNGMLAAHRRFIVEGICSKVLEIFYVFARRPSKFQMRPPQASENSILCTILDQSAIMLTSHRLTASKSKQHCEYFFVQDINEGLWMCRKCGNGKAKNGGWTNLLNHIKVCVGKSYEDIYDEAKKLETSSMGYFVVRQVSTVEKEMFEWIEFIVMKNLPIMFVDCPYTRKMCKPKPISSRSLRCHIMSLSELLKERVTEFLPDKFVLVFDGWTEGTQHYIGVSASYSSVLKNGKDVAVLTLLSMRPLLVEMIEGMTADDHLEHLSIVLRVYGKTLDNVVCLSGDNCSVNRKMSRTLGVPLLGCGSHKFNLAVRKWINNDGELEAVIEKVSQVMKKASTLKVAAKLRQITAYSTVRENDTRWSSTFQMIDRFLKIQGHLSQMVELLALLPNPIELDILTRAHVCLAKFNTVTVMLQKEGITFVQVREIFDAIMEDYPVFGGYLGDAADIVENKTFEKAVVKIAKGLQLTVEEEAFVRPLFKEPEVIIPEMEPPDERVDDDANAANNYAASLERRLKRRRRNAVLEKDAYMNLDILPGTSVTCERLFSLAKHVLTDTRKRTSPALFEALMLLKVNRDLWDVFLVGKAMGRTQIPQNANNDSDSDED
jgi:ribosomal protein L37AE/L43A